MSRVSPNNAGEGYSSGAPLVEAEAELGPDAPEEVEQMRSAEKWPAGCWGNERAHAFVVAAAVVVAEVSVDRAARLGGEGTHGGTPQFK